MKVIKFGMCGIIAAAFAVFAFVLDASQIQELMKEEKWTEAKKIAEASLTENNNDASIYLTIGICAVNQRNYNEAAGNLSKAHILNPKLSLPLYLLGVIFEETGSLAKARDYFKEAYKVEKDKEKRKDILKHIEVVDEKIEKEEKK
ncbi:MAG: hypothetical protein COT16_00870 [Elusimicrobia bacterium CG08_land_8_20_14_0_20_44_26]|nr:MAG: hypothetical protein COT16_00870 [Elusimicrobia bacterium CG08_land_8_20_14_0_20_44_26]